MTVANKTTVVPSVNPNEKGVTALQKLASSFVALNKRKAEKREKDRGTWKSLIQGALELQKGKIPLLLAVEAGNQSMCRELLSSQTAEQLKFSWIRSGQHLNVNKTWKFSVELKQIDSLTYESTLVIDKVAPADYGLYECLARNELVASLYMPMMILKIRAHTDQGVIHRDQFKVIYVAPMKALAAEMVQNFGKRLKPLGIAVRELTGDMSLTKTEMQQTQIDFNAPETTKLNWPYLVSILPLLGSTCPVEFSMDNVLGSIIPFLESSLPDKAVTSTTGSICEVMQCRFLDFGITSRVPPNIEDSLTSTDVVVREGANVTLKCRQTGSPMPSVKWKRDDNSKISIISQSNLPIITETSSVLIRFIIAKLEKPLTADTKLFLPKFLPALKCLCDGQALHKDEDIATLTTILRNAKCPEHVKSATSTSNEKDRNSQRIRKRSMYIIITSFVSCSGK